MDSAKAHIYHTNARKGLTPEQITEHYNSRTNYDQELHEDIYHGPHYAAQFVNKYFKDKKDAKILDVAAGTGKVGQELDKHGFTNLHALEPAEEMFNNSPRAKLYQSNTPVILERSTVTDFNDDTFDAIVIAGGMAQGLLPCASLFEMIRIVKPGGYIINVMGTMYIENVTEYIDRLVPFVKELAKVGKWHIEEITTVKDYIFDKDGTVFVLKVLESGCAPYQSEVLNE